MKISVLVFVALASLLLALCPYQTAQANERGWVLYQTSGFVGDFVIYFSPTGVKMTSNKMGCSVVMKAPQWRICIFNQKSRLAYYTTLQQLKLQWLSKRGDAPQIISTMRGAPRKNAPKVMVAGLKATEYTLDDTSSGVGRECKVWVSHEIPAPAQLTELLAKIYQLPAMKGVPLRAIYLDRSGNRVQALNTSNAQTAMLAANTFAYPVNYRIAKDQVEVLVNEEDQRALEDFLSEMSGTGTSKTTRTATSATRTNIRGLGSKTDKKDMDSLMDLWKDLQSPTRKY